MKCMNGSEKECPDYCTKNYHTDLINHWESSYTDRNKVTAFPQGFIGQVTR